MCGISGILNFNDKPVLQDDVKKMNDLIHHRGPDGEGIFCEGNIGLGSTRLAILDLRSIADQPMFDSTERYVIVYNGEIFNYIELRDDLIGKGYKFRTTSDTEVIINAYIEYGEDCLHKLNGMWAFALWDRKDKKLFCSRDRYGIKPFYYYKDNDRLIIGSEIKQILSCGVKKETNDEMVYDYLVFNFIDHTEQTFFKNIYKLPAGCKITVKGTNFSLNKWYILPENKLESNKNNSLYADFYELLYDSIRIRLRSDVEVGSCLSGGLDSSSIVCLMHDELLKSGKTDIQKTFTACFDDKEIDERQYVEEVIKQTNSAKYFLFPDSNELINDFDKMVWHQEEPFVGLTVFSQWSVFKKINETKIKVVLDGQGSDEILLGYFSFFPFYLKSKLMNPFKFISEYIRSIITSRLGVAKFTENLFYFNLPFVRYRHVTNSVKGFINRDFLESYDRKALFYEMIGARNLSSNRLANLWNISLPSLLRYEDKSSMAYSVEARLPFLDHRLVEFIFSIPFDQLIKNGWTKYVLRESMKGRIPEDIRFRKGKLAFSVPQKRWYKEIHEYIKKTMQNDFHASEYIEPEKLIGIFSSGNYNDKVVFRAFGLEKWMKVFDIQS
jgi:asparagine synthase (glutamine-hydrolysing)